MFNGINRREQDGILWVNYAWCVSYWCVRMRPKLGRYTCMFIFSVSEDAGPYHVTETSNY